MGRFIFGVIIGICLVAGGAFTYFMTGMAPVAATAQPMPFERFLAHAALHAKIDREAPKTAPIQPTVGNLTAGAHLYIHDCAFCHGMPSGPQSLQGRGMFPPAPALFTPRGMVTNDPVGVTFWKIKNGIRLTGMPSFERGLNTTQMWQIAWLMRDADKLPPAVSAVLAPPPAQPAKPAKSAEPRKRR
jgi:mono/diheme cytochrome c family protein